MTRNRTTRGPFGIAILTTLFVCLALAPAASAQEIAELRFGPDGIHFAPTVESGKVYLTVSGPGDYYRHGEIGADQRSFLSLFDEAGNVLPDGVYTYELTAGPAEVVRRDELTGNQGLSGASTSVIGVRAIQTGSFGIQGGALVDPDQRESEAGAPLGGNRLAPKDILQYDDVIITGSLCIGFDCVNGESFEYDTMKLKENNLRIGFDDTSTGTFPTGNWQIRINDSTSGGASYFGVVDMGASGTSTGGDKVFAIEAGAPSSSLYVEDYGRIGFGTSTPATELHAVDGDSPTLRLGQDGSSGFAAQTWDLAGNETNFFIRDVTNGSKLSFRIQPGAPSNTLTLRSDGSVGIGTWSPEANLHLVENGTLRYRLENTAAGTEWDANNDGSGDFAISLVGSGGSELEIEQDGDIGNCTNPDHDLVISTGPGCTATPRSWIDAGATSFSTSSSKTVKENLVPLKVASILEKIDQIPVYEYDFIGGPGNRVGLLAEDFHQIFGRGSDEELSGHEMQLAMWLAIQELNEKNRELDAKSSEIQDLKSRLEELERRLDDLGTVTTR